MSAGAFQVVPYEDDDGEKLYIRVQPETLAAEFGGALNSAAAGPITEERFVYRTKAKRQYGVAARGVTCQWQAAPPVGYKPGASFFIPILTQALYDAIDLTTTGEYLGQAIRVGSKNPEDVL